MLHPWHTKNWQEITSQWQTKPNAWLITGKAKTGKIDFAMHLAQALLCENPQAEHQPCNQCSSCHLFLQQSHPDFEKLSPIEDEGETSARKLKQIKVDAVRDALAFIYLSSHRGGMRVLLINPTETLNLQAANALLKALEEPPENVIFLLVCDNKDKLLPTIKSRCRQVPLGNPTFGEALASLNQREVDDAENLLAFHSTAPFFDLEPEQDALRDDLTDILSTPSLIASLDFAARFDQKKLALATFLEWIQKWMLDIALMQHAKHSQFYPAQTDALKNIANRINPIELHDFFAKINQLAPYGQHTLNVKLQLEAILIDYINLFKTKQSKKESA